MADMPSLISALIRPRQSPSPSMLDPDSPDDGTSYWNQLLGSVGGVPTPMGRVTPSMLDRAGTALAPSFAPSSNGLAEGLGAPVDAVAYLLRRFGMPADHPFLGSAHIADMLGDYPANAARYLGRSPGATSGGTPPSNQP